MRIFGFIIAALMFSAGVAFAQNNSTPGPAGLNSTNEAYQANYANEAFIEQAGDYSHARITQEGSHTASISQAGQGNSLGYQNSVIVRQFPGLSSTGGFNFPTGDSEGVPFTGSANKTGSASSIAEITQIGEYNSSGAEQYGSHTAEIFQKGDHNKAKIWQASEGSGTSFSPPGNPELCPPPFSACGGGQDGSYASVTQEGHGNDALINQLGGAHIGIIEQYGNDNFARILQSTESGTAGIHLIGNSLGTANNPVQNSTASEGLYGHIIQHNNGNSAQLVQSSNAIPITIEQFGNDSAIIVEHN